MKSMLSFILALMFTLGLSASAFAADEWMKTRAEDLPFEHRFDRETAADSIVASTAPVNLDKSSEASRNEKVFAEYDKPWRLH